MEQQHISLSRFRAELEVYRGPLDLLLHLVRQRELEITEVSLGEITDRYLAAIRAMEFFDVNVAAEFLVIAATLTELKSRALLPAGEAAEAEEDEDDDAGTELVRRLLEYKEFKEAAQDLDGRAERRASMFARPRVHTEQETDEEPEPAALLEDLATWDLLAAFARLVEQTSLSGKRHVIRSEVPVSAYIEEVLSSMRSRPGAVQFAALFAGPATRSRIVGVFLALLELVRRRAVEVVPDRKHPEQLRVRLCTPPLSPDPPDEALSEDSVLGPSGSADENREEPGAGSGFPDGSRDS